MSKQIHQQIILGNKISPNEVMGVANLHYCLALLTTLLKSNGDVETCLFNFLGVETTQDLMRLKNPVRFAFMIVSPEVRKMLECELPGGETCVQKIKAFGGEVIPLPDEDESVEDVVNAFASAKLLIQEALFEPKSIHDPLSGIDLILAAVAMERIKIVWETKFEKKEPMTFKATESGNTVFANFCGDDNRNMPYLRGTSFSAVAIPAKPQDGSKRWMMLLLPNMGSNVTKAFDELAAMYASKEANWKMTDVYLRFPSFKLLTGPTDISCNVKPFVPGLFDPSSLPFDTVLPTIELGNPAYVSKVIHFAMIEADENGAEAKAVTVAPVVVYRSASLPSQPKIVNCNRTFGVAMVEGGLVDPQNVEYVGIVNEKSLTPA